MVPVERIELSTFGSQNIFGIRIAKRTHVYCNVSDLEAAAARVRAAGGGAEAPTDEPRFGRFVSCRDPGVLSCLLEMAPRERL
jgi:predicted enzyme related to lactoylglutathione lyase